MKHAPDTTGVHDLIRRRWSPRIYSGKEVSSEVLTRLFEAARWAASSSNEQPWRFIVGRKGDETVKFTSTKPRLGPGLWQPADRLAGSLAPQPTLSTGARLDGASFVGCNLTDADFAGAALERADFTSARLDGTVFSDADLREARLVPLSI